VVGEGVTGLQLADHGWLPRGIDGAPQPWQEMVQPSRMMASTRSREKAVACTGTRVIA
jgi:hypothetical protein